MTPSLAKDADKLVVVLPTPAPSFDPARAYDAGILGSSKRPSVTDSNVESIVGCHSLICNG
jgi:hypothetical protein